MVKPKLKCMKEINYWLGWWRSGMIEANTPIRCVGDKPLFVVKEESRLYCPEAIIKVGGVYRNLIKIKELRQWMKTNSK